MTCAEFERALPDVIGGGRSAEQEAHLKSCPACSGLMLDLDVILRESRQLQAAEEPAGKVWVCIEEALREWESEMNAISAEASMLQASDEPSPRVWNSIQATVQQWESEMLSISEGAELLQASEEPSPRVWNSLEIALRAEGLIHEPRRSRSLVAALRQRWSPAWLVPVMAAILIAFGVTLYRPSTTNQQAASQVPTPAAPSAVKAMSSEDDRQVLAALASRTPALRDRYESDLRNVNAYIHDAEQSLKNDPNDELAQQSLMDAYEQKQVVYEMALDRSLP